MKTPIYSLCLALTIGAQAQTSENNARLQEALKRYPAADANKDGVLTMEEAKDFRKKASGRKTEVEDTSASKQVYKTVGGKSLELHVWKPEGHKDGAKVPGIVLFHGGGFRNGDYTQFIDQAEYFASRGMVAVSANYRLTTEPGVKIEDCVEDAKSAMRWVRANAAKLGIDPDKLAAGGGSAGGYLAAATLLAEFSDAKTDPPGVSAKPNAMVLFNPAFGSGRGENGEKDARDPEGKGDLRKYVKPGQPACINFYGTEDTLLPDARRFEQAYKKAGNRCEILTYEGQNHSFFNKPPYKDMTLTEADKFLVGLGWLAPQSETRQGHDK